MKSAFVFSMQFAAGAKVVVMEPVVVTEWYKRESGILWSWYFCASRESHHKHIGRLA